MEEQKPTENILIDYATNLTREELADFLIKIAGKIRDEGSFTFIQNEKDIKIHFADVVKTEIEYVEKGNKYELEIGMKWYGGQKKDKIEII